MLRRGVVAFALAVALLVSACEDEQPTSIFPSRTPVASPTSSDSRLVALVGTMSGPDSWRGRDAFEGAHLAVYSSLNRGTPEGAPAYELLTKDDGGDPAAAMALIEEQAADPRVAGIVFAGPNEALPEVEDALAQARIPLIACYGDLYGARLLSRHVFQASPSLVWEARRIASYFLRDRRYRRIGMLSPDDLFGQTARQAFTSALSATGGRLTASATFAPGTEDVTAQLKQLRSRRIEALFVPAAPADFQTVLDDLSRIGARYSDTEAARAIAAPRRKKKDRNVPWRPQVAGSDLAIAPQVETSSHPGLVAADSYARGSHYLPVPAFTSFRRSFEAWWGDRPLGWEQRAYEAVRLVGWADRNAGDGADLAVALEGLRGERFGGLDVTFGPDDHTAVDQTTVGLWVVPRARARVPERGRLPAAMPWVPLGRGFSIDGERTDILPEDWGYLFEHSPPADRPAPRFERARFGVTTPRKDPVH